MIAFPSRLQALTPRSNVTAGIAIHAFTTNFSQSLEVRSLPQ